MEVLIFAAFLVGFTFGIWVMSLIAHRQWRRGYRAGQAVLAFEHQAGRPLTKGEQTFVEHLLEEYE